MKKYIRKCSDEMVICDSWSKCSELGCPHGEIHNSEDEIANYCKTTCTKIVTAKCVNHKYKKE